MNKRQQIDFCLEKIMNLHAVEEFKETIRNLEKFRVNKEKFGVNDVALPNYLWVFNRGGGITTCVSAFADYLYESKIMEFKGKIKYFEFIPNFIPPDQPSEDITDLNNIISDSAGYHIHFQGIACIILDNWIGYTNEHNKHLLELLDFLENKSQQILSIFCIHTQNPSHIEMIETVISRYLRFETKRFRFPTTPELITFLDNTYLHKNRFTLSDDAKDLLTETINNVVSGENFNGFVTIKQLGNEILYRVLSNEIEGFEITAKLLSAFHKNSEFINSLKKIDKSRKTIGFETSKEMI